MMPLLGLLCPVLPCVHLLHGLVCALSFFGPLPLSLDSPSAHLWVSL